MSKHPNMIISRGLVLSFLFFGAHAIFSFVYADIEKTLVSWVMMQDRNITGWFNPDPARGEQV
jgi:hypothetical protein